MISLPGSRELSTDSSARGKGDGAISRSHEHIRCSTNTVSRRVVGKEIKTQTGKQDSLTSRNGRLVKIRWGFRAFLHHSTFTGLPSNYPTSPTTLTPAIRKSNSKPQRTTSDEGRSHTMFLVGWVWQLVVRGSSGGSTGMHPAGGWPTTNIAGGGKRNSQPVPFVDLFLRPPHPAAHSSSVPLDASLGNLAHQFQSPYQSMLEPPGVPSGTRDWNAALPNQLFPFTRRARRG